jgi:hypothetical protein
VPKTDRGDAQQPAEGGTEPVEDEIVPGCRAQLDILLHQSFVADIERARFINEEVAKAMSRGDDPPRNSRGEPYRIVDMIVVAPPVETGGTLDFQPGGPSEAG